MTGEVLTTWGVVLDVESDGRDEADEDNLADRAFSPGRAAYFERCPRLAAFLVAESATLTVTGDRLEVGTIGARGRSGLVVGVSVIEIRPTSFDMAVRIRPAVGDEPPVNGRCTIVIERAGTGERIPIPTEVRDEFIAIQLGARDLL